MKWWWASKGMNLFSICLQNLQDLDLKFLEFVTLKLDIWKTLSSTLAKNINRIWTCTIWCFASRSHLHDQIVIYSVITITHRFLHLFPWLKDQYVPLAQLEKIGKDCLRISEKECQIEEIPIFILKATYLLLSGKIKR